MSDAETLQFARYALDVFDRLGYKTEHLANAVAAEDVARILNAETARDQTFIDRDRACADALAAQSTVDALYRMGRSVEPCALPSAALGVELAERMIAEQDADTADDE